MRIWVWWVAALAVACSAEERRHDDKSSSSSATSSSSSSSSGSGGGASGCRSDADCDASSFENCYAPGTGPGCGACMVAEVKCVADTECKTMGDHFICAQVACPCSFDEMECQPGCIDDTGCGAPWLGCGADHRCAPKPCAGNGDCPAQFECGPDAACRRIPCTSDSMCDGFCVLGGCYSELGTCSEPAA